MGDPILRKSLQIELGNNESYGILERSLMLEVLTKADKGFLEVKAYI